VPFELVIVTPQSEAFRGRVESVVLPGSEGDFGVLEGHERFLSPLRQGEVEIRTGSQTQYAAIAAGFARVEGQSVSVLVDDCDLAEEIDVAAERAAEEAAEAALGSFGHSADPVERAAAEAALAAARNRLAVAARAKNARP
jgi:F-type H+-transporting ATPase subunit epsilon